MTEKSGRDNDEHKTTTKMSRITINIVTITTTYVNKFINHHQHRHHNNCLSPDPQRTLSITISIATVTTAYPPDIINHHQHRHRNNCLCPPDIINQHRNRHRNNYICPPDPQRTLSINIAIVTVTTT